MTTPVERSGPVSVTAMSGRTRAAARGSGSESNLARSDDRGPGTTSPSPSVAATLPPAEVLEARVRISRQPTTARSSTEPNDESGGLSVARKILTGMSTGYDTHFLGLSLPLPATAAGAVQLDYPHFSVLFRPDRRLAAVSAVNIHGALLRDIERTRDIWILDPRIPATDQLDEAAYDANDFDRGHLTRRRDPGWGIATEAKAANDATFHYTNAAPQASGFNQSKELWAGLEDYVLGHAATYEQRLAVFTGPILLPDDPTYRGVQIPLRFYKIAAWLGDQHVSASGYVLDQTRLVRHILAAPDRESRSAPPPLGAYRTFQVPIGDIARITDLTMPDLAAGDVLHLSSAVGPSAAPAANRWIELNAYQDGVLR